MPTGGSPFPHFRIANVKLGRNQEATMGMRQRGQEASAKRQCAKRFEIFRRQCTFTKILRFTDLLSSLFSSSLCPGNIPHLTKRKVFTRNSLYLRPQLATALRIRPCSSGGFRA